MSPFCQNQLHLRHVWVEMCAVCLQKIEEEKKPEMVHHFSAKVDAHFSVLVSLSKGTKESGLVYDLWTSLEPHLKCAWTLIILENFNLELK